MEAVREITVWEDCSRQPNHEYLLEGSRILAYRKWGQGEPIKLNGNIKIDRRGRKFIKLALTVFNNFEKESSVVEVKGSKGDSYFVNVNEGTCTCPGFNFRGKCKHVAMV